MNLDSIENVSQERLLDQRIDIYFTLEDFGLGIVTFNNEEITNLFTPVRIYHTERNQCPFCGEIDYDQTCTAFSDKDVSDVFQVLIEQPKIRLEWLFMPHV